MLLPAKAGLGASQLKVNASAIAMVYGVRVGVEDNIWWDEKRTRLATPPNYCSACTT